MIVTWYDVLKVPSQPHKTCPEWLRVFFFNWLKGHATIFQPYNVKKNPCDPN